VLAQDTTELETPEDAYPLRECLSRPNANQERAIRTGVSCTLQDYGRVRRTHARGHPDLRKHPAGIAAADAGLKVRVSRCNGSRSSEHRHQLPDPRPDATDLGSRSHGTPLARWCGRTSRDGRTCGSSPQGCVSGSRSDVTASRHHGRANPDSRHRTAERVSRWARSACGSITNGSAPLLP
jgi:hypothetical protein